MAAASPAQSYLPPLGLQVWAGRNELDGALVKLLIRNYKMINKVRVQAQTQAGHEYENFRAILEMVKQEDEV